MFAKGLSLIVLTTVLLLQQFDGVQSILISNVTTPNLIRAAGYPVEEYEVVTEDGYILTLFRIPYSPHLKNKNLKLPPIFVQHGILASSSDWVAIGPPDALAYLLCEAGFDVWLGNSRGNRYSLKHKTLNKLLPKYWNFDWHEMGVYDLPAVLNFVLKKTGAKQLQYVAHSQGSTEFIVFCTIYPSLCKKIIKAAHLLAPVVFTEHTRFPFGEIIGPLAGQGNPFINTFGSFNALPDTRIGTFIIQFLCNDYSNIQSLCVGFVNTIFGRTNYLNETLLPLLSEIYPEGASFKQLQHYAQGYKGHFRHFDYGPLENVKLYGHPTPPDYNLKNYWAKTFLYYSQNDFITSPVDILRFVSILPKKVVHDLYLVKPPKWNHLDYLFGLDIRINVYDRLMININKVRSPKWE